MSLQSLSPEILTMICDILPYLPRRKLQEALGLEVPPPFDTPKIWAATRGEYDQSRAQTFNIRPFASIYLPLPRHPPQYQTFYQIHRWSCLNWRKNEDGHWSYPEDNTILRDRSGNRPIFCDTTELMTVLTFGRCVSEDPWLHHARVIYNPDCTFPLVEHWHCLLGPPTKIFRFPYNYQINNNTD